MSRLEHAIVEVRYRPCWLPTAAGQAAKTSPGLRRLIRDEVWGMRDENDFGEAWLEEKAGTAREELARLGAVRESTHATSGERPGTDRLNQKTCLRSRGRIRCREAPGRAVPDFDDSDVPQS